MRSRVHPKISTSGRDGRFTAALGCAEGGVPRSQGEGHRTARILHSRGRLCWYQDAFETSELVVVQSTRSPTGCDVAEQFVGHGSAEVGQAEVDTLSVGIGELRSAQRPDSRYSRFGAAGRFPP